MLGEIALYSFVILAVTGIFLAMFFKGSSSHLIYHGSYPALEGTLVSEAYESVLHLSFDVPVGLLIRQMHHWAADIFVAAILLHLARIFLTAAYRRPRELNWIMVPIWFRRCSFLEFYSRHCSSCCFMPGPSWRNLSHWTSNRTMFCIFPGNNRSIRHSVRPSWHSCWCFSWQAGTMCWPLSQEVR